MKLLSLFGIALLALAGTSAAQTPDPATGHPGFLSPHARPIVESGGLVFVANTPADTVDVLDADTLAIDARVAVGIDPVSLAVRPDGKELWVSNHVSDSVSVIDTDATSPTYLTVVATVQDIDPLTRATRFDEPMGIAFANDAKAYVASSSENQIAVVDVATRAISTYLPILAQDPRAIVVRGDRLYVIPFESHNQTQISGCLPPLDGPLCTFDAPFHVVTNNNVLSRFAVVDIVKDPRIPDRDLYVFDTATDEVVEVVDGLGTLLYGIAVDSSGKVYVAQADARNDANGKAGTAAHGLAEMENRAFLNRITKVDCGGACGTPEFIDLEPVPPVHPAPGEALATPFAIQVSDDDSTLVVSAAGSNVIFLVDAATNAILGRTEVGAVPRGIALQSSSGGAPSRAWVLNAVANSVTLLDVSTPTAPAVVDTVDLEDPTHPDVKAGRMAFNDAGASTTGTFSCESCHPDGGTDQLVWVLDTPICDIGGCDQIPPRITMPIRGLRDTAPYHWDGIPGDPYGGNNTANINSNLPPNCDVSSPETCTRNLIDGGLASTMCLVGACGTNDEGLSGGLSGAERDAMARFLLSVPFPPAQRRAYDDALSSDAKKGFSLFHIEGNNEGGPQPNVCGNCHRMPFWVSTNTPGTGMDAPTWRGAYDRWLILPQGRTNIIDFPFFSPIADAGMPEFFVWSLSWQGQARFHPVWDMVLEGSTGFPGTFGKAITLNAASAGSAETGDLLDAMERSAREDAVLLVGEGTWIRGATPTSVGLRYDPSVEGGRYVERDDETKTYSRAELISLATSGEFVGTLTARIGPLVDVDHPQPGLWTLSPLHVQSGPQQFPTVAGRQKTMVVNGRHILPGASLFVDGRRVEGRLGCEGEGELPCSSGALPYEIRLSRLPAEEGMHFLQVQNPGGLMSNDFIFHVPEPGSVAGALAATMALGWLRRRRAASASR